MADSFSYLSDSGAEFSCQAALLYDLPGWISSPAGLERVARAYWIFLSRFTCGLLWVRYVESGRYLSLGPFKLLRFSEPDYFVDPQVASIRWAIEGGVLASRPGGMLELHFIPSSDKWTRVEIRVSGFHPSLPAPLYLLSQRAVHLLATRSFLRSLSRTDFPVSRTGRFS